MFATMGMCMQICFSPGLNLVEVVPGLAGLLNPLAPVINTVSPERLAESE